MLATEVNDYEDSTDEEIEEDADIPDSDAEQDLVIFPSDNEDSELEFESDYESTDDSKNDTENTDEDSESIDLKNKDSNKKTGKSSQIKGKADNKRLTNNSDGKKAVPKGKILANKQTRSISKLKNGKNQKASQEMQRDCKEDSHNNEETKDMSNAKHEKESDNEYEYDSSDEEDIRNTVGNVPLKWYDEYDHIGYDWAGKKILKPEKGDELDSFLKRMEDPSFWRTIKDPQTGQDVVLKDDDIDLIVKIQKQKIPDGQFDEYAVSYI